MIADAADSARLSQLPLAESIFGSTSGMHEVRKILEGALEDDLPVLIEGESGTGKEVVARYLHVQSERAGGPFVRVNCGAISSRLLDGEMFGQDSAASGSVVLAANGTLFLDEIAEMDAALQHKVAHALKTGQVRNGSSVNARIVCATSVDLTGAISGASPDLSSHFEHRVRLLPLRERKQDIPQLCEYLVEKFARNFGRTAPRLKPQVLDAFQQWNWPGNIRELENWIARIVIFGTEETMGNEFRRQTAGREGVAIARHHALRLNAGRMRRTRRHV